MNEVTIEAEITPGMAAAEVVELAVLAEQAGFDRLGISDVVFWPDCFVLLGLIAQRTTTISLGSVVTNPYSRHPAVLASVAATLQDASEGRAFLGLGVGAGLEALGMSSPRPVSALREAITTIRGLLAGDDVDVRGTTLVVEQARMVGPVERVPIAVGSRSPQVMRLAGEIADIALVGARSMTPEIASWYKTWLAEGAARVGRSLDDFEIAPRLTLCTSHDGDLARRSVRRYVAHYVALVRPADVAADTVWLAHVEKALARSRGWYFAHDRVDDPELDVLIDDDLVRRFAIAGTPTECADLTRDVLALGFASVSMNLTATLRPSMYAGLRETIEGFAEVIGSLRQTTQRRRG
jgi:5,10-methylenetetrahydromethanopterin reductase